MPRSSITKITHILQNTTEYSYYFCTGMGAPKAKEEASHPPALHYQLMLKCSAAVQITDSLLQAAPAPATPHPEHEEYCTQAHRQTQTAKSDVCLVGTVGGHRSLIIRGSIDRMELVGKALFADNY